MENLGYKRDGGDRRHGEGQGSGVSPLVMSCIWNDVSGAVRLGDKRKALTLESARATEALLIQNETRS